ncbi:response regulator transcription factor [Streptomyces sp. NPDC050263]|uniref:helix-turn-helix transcriptional regulator n=1 Tax=Streptomyces sp. NPDC050263 TaxID=3155037 RepID=UPI00343060E1
MSIAVTVHADDPLSRAGVVSCLRNQPGIEVSEGSGRGVRGRVGRAASVAVVLADRVDEPTAVVLRRLIRGDHRDVVLVVDRLREPELMTAVGCGVHTFVWRRQATPDHLLKAVRSAARGDSEMPPELLNQLLGRLGRVQRGGQDAPVAAVTGLAAREVEVLRFVAEGMENRQIAGKVPYSERTVKNILHELMTRMQLRNRAHAVAFALREGYL